MKGLPATAARAAQPASSHEEAQKTLALLKILALGSQQVAQGKVEPVADVVKRLRGLASSNGNS